jgi:uncharacterized protein (TIRG00374 family)
MRERPLGGSVWNSSRPGYSAAALPDNDVITHKGDDIGEQSRLPLRYGTLIARLAVSLLIAVCFVWMLRAGGLPLLPSTDALKHLRAGPIALYALFCTAATLLRTYRWNHLLRPINPKLSSRRVLGVSCAGLAAVLFAPFRTGELARPWLLARDGEVSFTHAAGTVVAERIVDGLTLTTILVVSLAFSTPLSPPPDHVGTLHLPIALVPAISISAFTTFAGAFVAMLLFYFWRATAHKVVFSAVGLVSKPLAGWITGQVERLADSLQFLFSRRHGLAFLRDTLLYWAAAALGHFLLLRGTGVPADFVQACVMLGVLGLSTVLPSAPGLFGTYQLGVYCGLAMFFPASIVQGVGALFAFVSYSVQLLLGVLCGLLGMRLLSTTARRHVSTASAP